MTDPTRVEIEKPAVIKLEWRGYTLELPPTIDDWDTETVEAFEQNRAITALRGVLGSAQFDELKAKFKAETGAALKTRDAGDLLESIAREYGFEGAGES